MSDRTRVFMLVSYLLDDNDNPVSEFVPLCGTKSQTVATEVVQTFLKHRNGNKTLAWEQAIRDKLPGAFPEEKNLSKILEDSPEENEDNLKKMIDF